MPNNKVNIRNLGRLLTFHAIVKIFGKTYLNCTSTLIPHLL